MMVRLQSTMKEWTTKKNTKQLHCLRSSDMPAFFLRGIIRKRSIFRQQGCSGQTSIFILEV